MAPVGAVLYGGAGSGGRTPVRDRACRRQAKRQRRAQRDGNPSPSASQSPDGSAPSRGPFPVSTGNSTVILVDFWGTTAGRMGSRAGLLLLGTASQPDLPASASADNLQSLSSPLRHSDGLHEAGSPRIALRRFLPAYGLRPSLGRLPSGHWLCMPSFMSIRKKRTCQYIDPNPRVKQIRLVGEGRQGRGD